MVTRLQSAVTNDGVELPVIDVTNPAFAVAATDVELEAMSTPVHSRVYPSERDAGCPQTSPANIDSREGDHGGFGYVPAWSDHLSAKAWARKSGHIRKSNRPADRCVVPRVRGKASSPGHSSAPC